MNRLYLGDRKLDIAEKITKTHIALGILVLIGICAVGIIDKLFV